MDDVWTVQGSMRFKAVDIPATMTVLRDPESGDVAILNSLRLDNATCDAIVALARPGAKVHVVRLGACHGKFDAWWMNQYPERCVMWVLPGYKLQDGLRLDHVLAKDSLPLADCSLFQFNLPKLEAAIWVQKKKLVVFCDAVVNMNSFEYCSFFFRPLFWWWGFYGSCHGPDLFYANDMRKNMSKESVAADYGRLQELDFDNYTSGHGPAEIGDARRKIAEKITALFS